MGGGEHDPDKQMDLFPMLPDGESLTWLCAVAATINDGIAMHSQLKRLFIWHYCASKKHMPIGIECQNDLKTNVA